MYTEGGEELLFAIVVLGVRDTTDLVGDDETLRFISQKHIMLNIQTYKNRCMVILAVV